MRDLYTRGTKHSVYRVRPLFSFELDLPTATMEHLGSSMTQTEGVALACSLLRRAGLGVGRCNV